MLLAVIGPQWLTAADTSGRPRLSDPQDLLRREIEAAIALALPIVPLLYGKTTMPKATDLPKSMEALASDQALLLRDNPDFDTDMKHIFETLDALADGRAARRIVITNGGDKTVYLTEAPDASMS